MSNASRGWIIHSALIILKSQWIAFLLAILLVLIQWLPEMAHSIGSDDSIKPIHCCLHENGVMTRVDGIINIEMTTCNNETCRLSSPLHIYQSNDPQRWLILSALTNL
mmetsp:Transcript_30915/g.74281  ORF Transcript_30915/g.74281 Transcript_30915/m.74281 type:complete len:108 (-) Transcript_30915:317-640(-)